MSARRSNVTVTLTIQFKIDEQPIHHDSGNEGLMTLGQANKIDCFSGIFLRKTHAGCVVVFFCCKPQPQTKNHKHPIVGNKIDPGGKLFSHAGSLLDEFYLCGLTYSALENA